MKSNFDLQELLGYLGIILAVGIAWGVINQKVEAQEHRIKELGSVGEQISILTTQVQSINQKLIEVHKDVRELRANAESHQRQSRP